MPAVRAGGALNFDPHKTNYFLSLPSFFLHSIFTPFGTDISSQPYSSFFQLVDQEDYSMLLLEYIIVMWLGSQVL